MHLVVIALLVLASAMPAYQLDALVRRDIAGIALLSPGNLTTCTPVALTWAYSPAYVQPDMVMTMVITNVGVEQFAPPLPQPISPSPTGTGSSTGTNTNTLSGSSTSFTGTFPSSTPTVLPPGEPTGTNPPAVTPPSRLARDAIAPITLTIATNLPLANATGAREFDWPAVAVPQGWYVIMGSSPDLAPGLTVANTSRFYVADSGDDSCIAATPSASDTSGSSIATDVPSSSSSHMSTGGVVGAVIGGIVAIAVIIGLIAWWVLAPKRTRRRGGGNRGPWGQVHSADSRAGASVPRTPHYGSAAVAAAAGRSARSLPGDETDSLSSEKLDVPPASAPVPHRSSAASAASLYKPTRSRSSQPITPEAEGYALGVIGRAGVTPSPTIPSPPAAAGKKTPRKPVPAYNPRDMEGVDDDAESTVVGSHASASGVLRKGSGKHSSSSGDDAFPFVLNGNGSTAQVHYLVPDPLPPPAR